MHLDVSSLSAVDIRVEIGSKSIAMDISRKSLLTFLTHLDILIATLHKIKPFE